MKKAVLFLLLLFPCSVFSQEKDVYTIVTLYNGIALRPENFIYLTEASIEQLKTNGLEQTDQGLSINYELLGTQGSSLGLKYYRTIFVYFPILYAAVQPSYFNVNHETGWNVKPELGLVYDPIWQHTIGLRFKLGYGYDIPLSNQHGFFYNRSIIEFKVGVTINVHHTTSY